MAKVRDPGVRVLTGPVSTPLDRAIAVFSPKMARDRAVARVQLHQLHQLEAIGGYTGAATGRRSFASWFTSRGSADVDVLPSLRLLRERSRDLVRNNPIAAGAIGGTVTSVVGTGLVLKSELDADALGLTPDEAAAWQRTTEREWRLWAETTDCDITRCQDFYGLQDLVFRSTLENGDAISLLPMVPRKGAPYALRVQVIEADRLCNRDRALDTPTHAGGVVMDDYGAPTAYEILRQHPGGYWTAAASQFQWDTYPAFGQKTGRRNVLHHFRRVRPAQTRGVPFLAPVVEIIKQIGRWTDAEVMAAVVSGLFTVFVTTPTGAGIAPGIPGTMADETGATASDADVKMGNGNIVDLKTGEEISTAAPGRPNPNFDPFFESCIRQIGMATEIPFEVLIKHFTASYTAARAAILEAWKFYNGRRAWLVQSFCDPVYEAWMDEAVAAGRIAAPGYFADPARRRAYLGCSWHGDAMPQVDPVKEVLAARGRVDLMISSRARETAQLTGGDWGATITQLGQEKKQITAAGLDPAVGPLSPLTKPDTTPDGGSGATPPAPPNAPATDTGSDTETPPAPASNPRRGGRS